MSKNRMRNTKQIFQKIEGLKTKRLVLQVKRKRLVLQVKRKRQNQTMKKNRKKSVLES